MTLYSFDLRHLPRLCFLTRHPQQSASKWIAAVAVMLSLAFGTHAAAQTMTVAGAVSSYGSSLTNTVGIATDSSQNVYVALSTGSIYKETYANTSGLYTEALLFTTSSSMASGIAVSSDGSTIYVGTGVTGMSVGVYTGSGAHYALSATMNGFTGSTLPAVDNSGAIFVADQGSGVIYSETYAAGSYSKVSIASGFTLPSALSTQGTKLYVADSGTSTISALTYSGGAYTKSALTIPNTAGLSGVAVDSLGSIYFETGGEVYKASPGSGTTYTSALFYGYVGASLAIDPSNNLYLGSSTSATGLQLVPYTSSGFVNYGSAYPGNTPVRTIAFTATAGGTLGAPTVVTQGLTGADYNMVGAGTTCSGTIATGASCNVVASFSPKASGTREGAAKLTNSQGTAAAVAYLGGSGYMPLALLTSTLTPRLLTSSLQWGRGLSVDAAGNIYVSNQQANEVLEFPGGYGPGVALATSADIGNCQPGGTAIDGAGNLFVACNGFYLYELPAGTTTWVPINVGNPQDDHLSIDAAGNVYFTGFTSNQNVFYKMDSATHAVSVIATGPSNARFVGATADPSGNVFAIDFFNNVLYEIPAGSSNLTTLYSGSPLNNPTGIALDAVGNLYIVNYSETNIYRFASANYSTAPTTLPAFGTDSIVIDSAGTFYTVASDASLYAYSRNAAALTFPQTAVGLASPAQSVTLENDGPAPLTFSAPTTGTNPSASTNFTLSSSSTCPSASATSGSATLASNSSCTSVLSFTPTAVGAITGSLTYTDNSLLAVGATQIVGLSGTGVQGTPTVTVANLSQNMGATPILTAVVSGGGDSPTGSVTFAIGSGSSVAATCTVGKSSETCTASYPAAATSAAGTYTITAIVAADTTYQTASGMGMLTINPVGPATQLGASAVASTLIAGGNLGTVTATIKDANGYTVTSSTASVTVRLTGSNGYSQVVIANAVSGVASLNLASLNLTTAGTYTVTTSSPGLTGTSSTVVVTAATPAKLVPGAIPATVVAGTNLGALAVTVEDSYGNTASSSTATVTVHVTGPNGYSQNVIGTAVNGVASLNVGALNLSAKAGTYTVAISSPGLTGTSNTVVVTAATPAKLVPGAIPATVVAGTNLGALAVTIEDTYGNTAASSTATVTALVTGPNGYSQTVTGTAIEGVASLNVGALNLTAKAGTYTVAISSPGLTGTSNTVVVTAATPAKLVPGAIPATVVAGTNLGALAVTVEDSYGNTASSSTAAVTVHVTANEYSQTLTANAVNGVASLNVGALNLTAIAGTYTVAISSPGLTGTSNTVVVTAGTASKLSTSTVASTVVSGGSLGIITATVEDASGATVMTSTAAVTATITGPNGYSQTVTGTAVNGVAALNLSSLKLTAAGSYTVTTSSAGLTGTSSTVGVTAGTSSKVALGTVPTNIASGQSLGTTTATIEDANGNTVTNSTVAITATLTGPNGYSQTVTGTSVNGVVSLNLGSLAPTTAGTYTLTVAGNGLTSVISTITVADTTQTISLPNLSNETYGAAASTLPLTTSAGLPIVYTVTGPATLNGSSLVVTGAGTVTVTATQAGDASHSPVTVTRSFTVAKAASTTKLSSSSGVATIGSSVTLTTQVASTAGTPTGTVTFLDGSTVLGTATVSSTGTATLTLTTLPSGALNLSAAYSGDLNFLASVSAIAVADVQDFGIAATGGTPSVAVVPGAAADFTLALTPGAAGFSSAINLAVTGLPTGATYGFSPAAVTPGSAVASTVLTVQTARPVTVARNLGEAAGISIALLSLPFGLSRRGREALKRSRLLSIAGLLLLLEAAAGLTGCGTSNGFFGQPQQSYTVTVTGTSGTLVHSTTVVLNVQ